MSLKVALCLLLVFITFSYVEGGGRSCYGRVLTKKRVQEIKKDLKHFIKGNMIPQLLRLSFHICVGGCDGCINPRDPDNAGLMLVGWARLIVLYRIRKYSKDLSLADFIALAGIVAMENGIANANDDPTTPSIPVPEINFQYCRQDCRTAPITKRFDNFPSATFGHSQVYDFFEEEFNLDRRAATALLGVHTLGKARSSGSGYHGFWKEGQAESIRMDNRFYVLMRDRTLSWEQVDANRGNRGPPRWQWEGFRNGTQGAFFLQADLAMYRVLDLDGDGRSRCEGFVENCPGVPETAIVAEYAMNGTSWIFDFADAFTNVINNGATHLLDLA